MLGQQGFQSPGEKLLSNLEPQGVEVHQYKSPVNFKNPASEYAKKKENPVENDAEEKLPTWR